MYGGRGGLGAADGGVWVQEAEGAAMCVKETRGRESRSGGVSVKMWRVGCVAL